MKIFFSPIARVAQAIKKKVVHRFTPYILILVLLILGGFANSLSARWHKSENLGGDLASVPAVCSWGANRLDVFVQRQNNHMFHSYLEDTRWSQWKDLGGSLKNAPACVSWGPDRIDCFIQSQDNHLNHIWWDGTQWSQWKDLGGTLTSASSVCSWGVN